MTGMLMSVKFSRILLHIPWSPSSALAEYTLVKLTGPYLRGLAPSEQLAWPPLSSNL